MATETSRNHRVKKGDMRVFESDVEAVADTIILDGLTEEMPHCFIGVQFFSDAGGTTPATPGAGTVAVTVETLNNEPVFEAVPDSPIDATAPTTLSWAANTKRVRLVPTGITTATHWKAVWTGNRS